MRAIRVRVPCSTSNLGAGFDCVGLALDRYLTATLHASNAPLEIQRSGTLASVDEAMEDDLLVRAMRAQQADPRGVLELHSDIPIGRGLGSSAAAAVAGIMLAAALKSVTVEREYVAAYAAYMEDHPDNAVPATFGGLMAAITENLNGTDTIRVHRLRLSNRIGFVYAAPQAMVSTKAARRALPEQVAHGAATRGISRAFALLEGLAEADPEMLRIGFTDELHVPYRLPMIPGGEAVLQAAVAAGAHAATISGSGSGLIAACPRGAEEAVRFAMQRSFEAATGAEAIAFVAEPDHDGARFLDT
jgi:homoserine kinase